MTENKRFKCKYDHTIYTLEPVDSKGKHKITWVYEDGLPTYDTWDSSGVDENFRVGTWYFFEEKEDSIARPVLEERKVGKIRMDLFDEGFPNAVLEIAKVMTWANENKGYKDHDWKQLPNASKDIPAAASRHGIKQLIQKAKGIPAIERTDEESNIVHLAHQCFNLLAELELVLTGVIE